MPWGLRDWSAKSSDLTPAISLGSSFKYTTNPEKAENPVKDSGTVADLSLTFTMGLGEYGIGDEVICTPSLMYMHMRTFNDPISGYGDELQLYDVDVIVAGVSLPFILPNDFSLTLGHTYAHLIHLGVLTGKFPIPIRLQLHLIRPYLLLQEISSPFPLA